MPKRCGSISNSPAIGPPKGGFQICVARDLGKLGFGIHVETKKTSLEDWASIRLDKRQQVDLLIWNRFPGELDNLKKASLRAIVEFKLNIYHEKPRSDIERTARALRLADDKNVMGIVIVCHSDFDTVDLSVQHIDVGRRLAETSGCAFRAVNFDHAVGDGRHHYGTVMALTVKPATIVKAEGGTTENEITSVV